MPVRALFFDLGGVLLRTEYQAPREHLAERLNTSYEDLIRLVFESETSRQASVGAIMTEAHWENITRRLRRPLSEASLIREEFFAGDILDRELLDFIRSLRPRYKTGAISNAWPDMREYMISQKMDDAFDEIIISAEVGIMKPERKIYEIALEKLGVKPREAVFVDDTPPNVEAAQALGMQVVHFRDPARALDQLRAIAK